MTTLFILCDNGKKLFIAEATKITKTYATTIELENERTGQEFQYVLPGFVYVDRASAEKELTRQVKAMEAFKAPAAPAVPTPKAPATTAKKAPAAPVKGKAPAKRKSA